MKRQRTSDSAPYRCLITLISALFVATAVSASSTFEKPDFAYPRDVIRDADAALARAVRDDDAPVQLLALMQKTKAAESIDADSLKTSIADVLQYAARQKTPDAKAMFNLYAAQLYNKYRADNRWRMRGRTLPQGPRPADIAEWDTAAFTAVVDSLLAEAWKAADNTTIERWAKAVKADRLTRTYYPAVCDFVASKILEGGLMHSPSLSTAVRGQILAKHPEGSAPWMMWTAKLAAQFAPGDNAKATLDLWARYKANPNSEIIAYTILTTPLNLNKKLGDKAYLATLRDLAQDTRGTWVEPYALNAIADFTKPSISIHPVGEVGIAGQDIILKYTVRNVKTAELRIYTDMDYTINRGLRQIKSKAPMKLPVKTLTLNLNATDPTVDVTDSVAVQLPIGEYAFTIAIEDKEVDNYGFFKVIGYMPVVTTNDTGTFVTMLEATTGKPVQGLEVLIDTGNKKKRYTSPGRTDAGGTVKMPRSVNGTICYRTSTGIVDCNKRVYVRPERRYSESPQTLTVSTDLSTYRPGQQVRWIAVLADTVKALPGVKLDIELHSNEKTLAEDKAVTDAYGRATGTFTIPEDTRMGTHRIYVRSDNASDVAPFTVGDFSLPQARLDSLVAIPDHTTNSAVIRGLASSYAGLPIAGATVTFRDDDDDEICDTVTTGADGRFELHLDSIKGSDKSFAEYFENSFTYERRVNGTITLTTPMGTTISENFDFDAIFPNKITVDVLQNGKFAQSLDASQPVILKVGMTAPDKTEIKDVSIVWAIKIESHVKGDSIVRQGTATVGEFAPDISGIAPGEYLLEVCPQDSTAVKAKRTIPIYDTKVNVTPDGEIIWTPDSRLGDGILTLCVNGNKDIHIIFAAENGTPVIRRFKGGWHRVNLYEIFGDNVSGRVVATGIRNGEYRNTYFEIDAKPEKPQMRVITETFRDRVTAGAREQWRLRTVDADGRGVSAALALNMYDTRILTFYSMSTLRPALADTGRRRGLRLEMPHYRGFGFGASIDPELLDVLTLDLPEWIYGESRLFIRGYGRMYKANSRANNSEVEECCDMATAEGDTSKLSGEVSGVQSAYAAITPGIGEGPVLNELVIIRSDSDKSVLSQVEFRKDDVLNALWLPTLTTDRDGYADVKVDIPATPSTWHFTATAWTKDMRTASLKQTVTSVKPVIVKAVVPQFIRRGDSAELLTNITNNTDAPTRITAVAEVFDVKSDSVLASKSYTLDLAPGASGIVSMDIEERLTLADADSLGFRVRAANDVCGDGEQYALPLLASSARVTDSRNFYLGAADSILSLDLPAIEGTDAVRSLHFTANPMWSVVEALPSITEIPASTATCAANAYFGSVIALSLHKAHPELQIPVDVKQAQAIRRQAVKILSDLQRHDGGLSWGKWCSESSLWATIFVLDRVATLRMAGYDTADIDALCTEALRYADERVEAPDYTYAALRPAWDTPAPSLHGRQVIDKTVQHIIKNWKKFSVHDKAVAALVLHYNANRAMARTIIGSLDQFGTHRPGKGMEFRNVRDLLTYGNLLEAYGAVTGQSAQTDAIREYLIVRRQGTDWGNSALTAYTVDAFINSGTSWASNPVAPYVTFGDRPVAISDMDGRKGVIDAAIADTGAGTLTLDKHSDVPAYGAVTDVYTAEASKIDAFTDGEVSIDKMLTVTAADGKTYAIGEDTAVPVGSTVTVRLTIKADRPFSTITISDERPAGLIPQEQVSQYVWNYALGAYRESRPDRTNFYIYYMPKGVYVYEYTLYATVAGTYTSGIATVTCDQAPDLTAHSSGSRLTITK